MNIKAIHKELLALYPNKVVSKLNNRSKPLYQKLARISALENKGVREYLNDLGFKYVKKYEDLDNILRDIYPNNIIMSISEHKSIHQMLRTQARDKGISVKEYLTEMGFIYRPKKEKQVELKNKGISIEWIEKETQSLKETLMELYPNMIVTKICEKTKSQKLYYRVRKLSKLEDKTVEVFLGELGFTYIGGKSREPELLMKLEKMFPDKMISFSEDTRKIIGVIGRFAKEQNLTIDEYLKSIGYFYKKENRMIELNFEKYLLEIYPNKIIDESLVVKDRSLYGAIRKKARQENKSVLRYIEKMGFTFTQKRERNRSMDLEQELLKFFPTRKIVDIIKLDIQLYLRIQRRAKKEKITISKYFKKLGFTYVPKNQLKKSKTEVKRDLLKLYPDKKIVKLRKRNQKLYSYLCGYVARHKVKLNDYLMELGFQVN